MNDLKTLNHVKRKRTGQRESIHSNKVILREIRTQFDPFSLSDEVFQGMYTLSKVLAKELIERLGPYMPQPKRRSAIPVERKVLCALYFYGHGCYQISSEMHQKLGLSQSTISRGIEEVTAAINTPEILPKLICFPLKTEERSTLIRKNYLASHIPGVIGFVDSMHVAFKRPKEDEDLFLNGEDYHSINAMIVCDSDLLILNCLPRYGGNSNKSFVWNKSAVRAEMMEVWEGGDECWLLGDSGYPHELWLQTPILNAPDCSPESHYTSLHYQACSAAKRCIGLLRGRFKCLQKTLEYNPSRVGRIINACVGLHNLCLRSGLASLNEVADDTNLGQISSDQVEAEQMPDTAQLVKARMVRQRIVDCLQEGMEKT